MNRFEGKIGVTGASGQLGGSVVELLAEQVKPSQILALSRSPEKLSHLKERGVGVAQGDFTQPEQLADALKGVDRLLIISTDDISGNRAALHANAVAAAKEAGVAHIVYTSAPNPHISSLAFIREHGVTEDLIRESGVAYTFLRNNFYMEMLLGTAPKWAATGEIHGVAAKGSINRVTREDCARAAAAVLAAAGTEHHNKVYDITGPGSRNGDELADAIAEVAGRPVRYVSITPDAMQEYLREAGFPEPLAALFVAIDQAIAAGELDVSSSAVRELTGQDPTSVTEFLNAHRSALMSSVAN